MVKLVNLGPKRKLGFLCFKWDLGVFTLGIRSDWLEAEAVRGLDFPQIPDRRATVVCGSLDLSLSTLSPGGGGLPHFGGGAG